MRLNAERAFEMLPGEGNQEEHRPPSKSQFRRLPKSLERLQSCLELEEDPKSFEIYILATRESREITPFSLGLQSNRTKDKGHQMPRRLAQQPTPNLALCPSK